MSGATRPLAVGAGDGGTLLIDSAPKAGSEDSNMVVVNERGEDLAVCARDVYWIVEFEMI